jgi:ATP-dependent exoDNAse (exonuclease V) beta subunit
MTIHKAKGLEFDTVILPGLDASPRSDDHRLLLWLEHRGELLVAPISESGSAKEPMYRYLEIIERSKSQQEVARLLYVAATRARSSLHLLGSAKLKEDGTIAEPDSRSFLKLLWPMVVEQFANPMHGSKEEPPRAARTIRRLPANWRVPSTPPPVEWERPGIPRVLATEVAFEWANHRSRYAGAALHSFLRRIAREGLDAWDEAAVRSHRPAYRAVLTNLGVPKGDLAWAIERVEAGLLRTVRDPRGRWVLSNHADAASELPIAGLIDGNLSEVVIDRTFVDENGVRWIIDYKTSAHEGAGLENFLEQEKDRYREQLERYARLIARRDDRPVRLGLYFPLMGEWLEWAAPVVLRKQAMLFEL